MIERDSSTLDERLASVYPDVDIVSVEPLSGSRYLVVSIEGETPRVQRVDTEALSCDCPRGEQRDREINACVHLSHVLVTKYKSESRVRRTVLAIADLVREVLDRITPEPASIEEVEREVLVDGGIDVEATQSGGTWYGLDVWVDLARDFYEARGFDADDLEIFVETDREAIAIRADSMGESDFQRLKQLNRDHDKIRWDHDRQRSYVKREDVGEVFQT